MRSSGVKEPDKRPEMNSPIFETSAVLGKGTLFEVSAVVWRGHLKRLTLRPGPSWLTVPRSSCVSTGDQIQLCDAMAWVICHNGRAQILQPYTARETLTLGGLRIDVLVQEITAPGEHEAYSSLAEYHYRERSIHGRTARLIARAFHPLFPQVPGYIELVTPFYMKSVFLSKWISPKSYWYEQAGCKGRDHKEGYRVTRTRGEYIERFAGGYRVWRTGGLAGQYREDAL